MTIRPHTLAAIALLALATTSCSTIFAVKGQQRLADANCIVSGTVTTEKPARGPLVVGIFTRSGEDYVLVDYFTASKPGSTWMFGVRPGTYWIAAFEDVNGDGAYEDEPFYRPDPAHPLVLTPGQQVQGMKIVIPLAGRAFKTGHITLSGMMARPEDDQRMTSLYAASKLGEVTTLADPRFAEDVAEQGMWKFYDFLSTGQAGIYFLEPYDPKRIPVLFVHGINGTPRNFTHLIASLDRTRFQPWVVYYPSGARLDRIVGWLDELFTRLEVSLRFDKAVVVAHSMGGLVARGFVLRHHETSAKDPIRMLVTISSPLGGMASAGEGVETSPIVVRSWYGLAPGSEYLDGLFYTDPVTKKQRRHLPEKVAYHMLFGFKGGGRGGASDGVVAVASQLRPEAQDEALSIRGYDETHTGILDSAAVAVHLNEILTTVK